MFTNLQVPRLRVLLVAGLIAATSLSGSQLANAQTTAASEWTWMGGSSTVPGAGEGYPGVYGTLGTPTAANIPGGRKELLPGSTAAAISGSLGAAASLRTAMAARLTIFGSLIPHERMDLDGRKRHGAEDGQ